MMAWVWNAFFLLLTLGVLVTVHEFGHFWVARRLGVKVEVFSIGFGNPLFSRVGRDGVEYRVAWIPLGGYVRMLDEREYDGVVPDAERAFNRQSLWVRTAVVLAGPFANFLFAILAFTLMYWVGVNDVRTVLGPVPQGTPAAEAGFEEGMEVLAVEGAQAEGWTQFNLALVEHISSNKSVSISVKQGEATRTLTLAPFSLEMTGHKADLFKQLGFSFQQTSIPATLEHVEAGLAADRGGLKAGDTVTHFDGEAVSWDVFSRLIQAKANQEVTLNILRDQRPMELKLVVGARRDGDNDRGYLGVSPRIPEQAKRSLITVQYGVWDGFAAGTGAMIDTTMLTLNGLYKLVTGSISLKTLSGPVSIAQGAGATASVGVDRFLWFLGLVSVNLGLINLLPIPVLDGGHLIFNVAEAIRGKPLSERVQEWGLRIGMSLVGALMFLALYNDFARM